MLHGRGRLKVDPALHVGTIRAVDIGLHRAIPNHHGFNGSGKAPPVSACKSALVKLGKKGMGEYCPPQVDKKQAAPFCFPRSAEWNPHNVVKKTY